MDIFWNCLLLLVITGFKESVDGDHKWLIELI